MRRSSRACRGATSAARRSTRLYALGLDAFRVAQAFVDGAARAASSSTARPATSRSTRRQFVREGRLARLSRRPARPARRRAADARARSGRARRGARRALPRRAAGLDDRRAQLPHAPRRDRPHRARRRDARVRRGAPAPLARASAARPKASPRAKRARIDRRGAAATSLRSAREPALPLRRDPARCASTRRASTGDATSIARRVTRRIGYNDAPHDRPRRSASAAHFADSARLKHEAADVMAPHDRARRRAADRLPVRRRQDPRVRQRRLGGRRAALRGRARRPLRARASRAAGDRAVHRHVAADGGRQRLRVRAGVREAGARARRARATCCSRSRRPATRPTSSPPSQAAHEREMRVVALTGKGGGRIGELLAPGRRPSVRSARRARCASRKSTC